MAKTTVISKTTRKTCTFQKHPNKLFQFLLYKKINKNDSITAITNNIVI